MEIDFRNLYLSVEISSYTLLCACSPWLKKGACEPQGKVQTKVLSYGPFGALVCDINAQDLTSVSSELLIKDTFSCLPTLSKYV